MEVVDTSKGTVSRSKCIKAIHNRAACIISSR